VLLGAKPAPIPPETRSRELNRWAFEIVARGADATVEDRQRAARYIADALALEPDYAGHYLVLGRLHDLAEEDLLARASYRHAIELDPTDPEPRMRIAVSWKRTWLRTLDPTALVHAIAELDTVTRIRPYGSDGWLRLAPLLYEHGEIAAAEHAAEHALTGRPLRPEAPLAAAYLGYRMGEIERADSLFRVAIPQLEPELRALMEDPLKLLRTSVRRDTSAADSSDARSDDPLPSASLPFALAHASAAPATLAELDPDPTTIENEAELECWSRIAHAWLLLYDPRRPGLDARAETYIRYGPPASVHLNPPGTRLYFDPNPLRTGENRTWTEFPLDAQLWLYPDLGMQILLHDRSLTGRYTQPVALDYTPGATPDANALAHRPDLIALDGGRSVIATLPASGLRLDVQGAVSSFEGPDGPRVLVQARVPGSPGDSLIARWVARDLRGHVVTRGEQSPSPSACDPTDFRLAEFAAELPAGRYDIAVSLHDPHGRRGLYRTGLALAPASGAMSLSDLVLCCGDPSQLASEGNIRIEADPDRVVRGSRPAVAYFEIYRLAQRDGASRFRYEYEVRRPAAEPGAAARRKAERMPALDRWVSRDESFAGDVRRQFIRVPTVSLAAGRFQLWVRVHDLVSGADAERVTEFVHE
jgi:tetratricopeptide (TPR) repeat protein